MASFAYSLPSDNRTPSATVTLPTGTADTEYPLANVYDLDPAKPFKTTGAGDVAILIDHGSAKRVDLVAVPITNLPAAHSGIKFQMNATDSWGAPTVDATLTVPAYDTDGFHAPIWKDLTGESGYSVSGFRYNRLFIPSTGAAVALGELWIGSTKRQDIHQYNYGIQHVDQHPVIEHRTDFGVRTRYRLGVRLRRAQLHIRLRGTTETSAVLAWLRDAAGAAKAFLWIPDAAVNDAWMALFGSESLSIVHTLSDIQDVDLAIEEMSRGLAL